ncbi:ABC transporter permease [Amycolatopsis saalfeldensis]|uniref:Peptide/nickel transport system permease protein n=1 Tax=Amycolatopsis saalfeldensis TaxID=394193 RepID=A0A1H8VJ20_9PSEU|nr:ABC transporter permease [Amycolatopsis saalfeldensis]SEP15369.1 peptide/nickel transport system permease protein [Amycolatopsis saalfeldensis]
MKFLARRAAQAMLVVCGVVVLTFLLLHLIPGDPARQILGTHATDAQVAALRQQWGLDRPLTAQFGSFVAGLFTRADTGTSLFYGVPARSLIEPRIGLTVELVVMAGVACVLISVPLAVWAAVAKDRLPDQLIRIIPAVGAGMPAIWLGLLLIILFSVRLHWFPVGGAGPGAWLTSRGLVLPAFTAALAIAPLLIRSLRAELLEVLQSDYIAAARTRSLSETRVLFVHAARNAVVPMVTLLGLNLAYLVGGTVVVEQVFDLNGLGGLMFTAIGDRDFPVVQGIALLLAVVVVVVNLLTEAGAALVDPRLRARA